ncbi:MAG TPA: aspartate aminotransferase family protein [Chthoniobacterales bacterium]|nr:aspartate aminotransferase family protein [Chthoniobacterales bacterium]
MNESSTKQLFADFVVPCYGRYDVVLTRGEGVRVWDEAGNGYLDFGAGIAVSTLGHAHPRMVQALSRQAGTLIHTSNLYYTEPQGRLAKRLVELAGSPGKVFFSNSGAEANEALFKVARKYGNDCRSTPQEAGTKVEIITFERSFHGRTMAGISATGQEKVKTGFAPFVPGFRHLPFNDLAAVEKAMSSQTVGVLLEAFQGEGGIFPASREFLIGLRRLCDEHQMLLMFDEIQCGLGRVGNWCGWKAIAPEVVPDAVSWAKGIGGGFPLGATWLRAKPIQKSDGSKTQLCDLLQPGSHGTTYGGTPLACAVSLAVLQTIEDDDLVERAAKLGSLAMEEIKKIQGVKEVRGKGLLIGIDLEPDLAGQASPGKPVAQTVVTALMRNGLLTAPAGGTVVRWLPPLIVTESDILEAVNILDRTLQSFRA